MIGLVNPNLQFTKICPIYKMDTHSNTQSPSGHINQKFNLSNYSALEAKYGENAKLERK
jgi:hypothetical protein